MEAELRRAAPGITSENPSLVARNDPRALASLSRKPNCCTGGCGVRRVPGTIWSASYAPVFVRNSLSPGPAHAGLRSTDKIGLRSTPIGQWERGALVEELRKLGVPVEANAGRDAAALAYMPIGVRPSTMASDDYVPDGVKPRMSLAGTFRTRRARIEIVTNVSVRDNSTRLCRVIPDQHPLRARSSAAAIAAAGMLSSSAGGTS